MNNAQMPNQILLNVSDLSISFGARGQRIKAVNDLSMSIRRGEIVGVLGESGSGKSVTAAAMMGLIQQPPGSIDSGSIRFNGRELVGLTPGEHRRICGNEIAMVFQDALAALNPVYSVGWQIAEMFRIHGRMSRQDAHGKAVDIMEQVGIPDAVSRADLYPHQFSGGMRQRVMIAMAIALRPSLIIADEPTTALDVTVQAQIVELLKTIRSESGSAIMLITHDLGLIAECADRAVVMYGGRVVEEALVDDLFHRPSHPYTIGLLASRPTLTASVTALDPIAGSPPDPAHLPPGCAFAPRCKFSFDRCHQERPAIEETPWGTRRACHLPIGALETEDGY